MLKILLKNQLYALNSSFFYDRKKGKVRSKTSSAVFIGLYVLLMLFVAGIFTAVSIAICEPFANMNLDWLYLDIMLLTALLMGVFGSVFNTYSSLYKARDNDLMLSLPIPVRYILITRLLGVYLMGLMFSSVVMLPAVIVWFVVAKPALSGIIGGLMAVVLASVFVFVLSCLLGWIVARVSVHLKSKSLIVVIISLAFFGLYYYFCANAYTLLEQLILNALAVGRVIIDSARPVYLIGLAFTGDLLSLLCLTAAAAALLYLTCLILSRSFVKLATSPDKTAKKEYRSKSARMHSRSSALLQREAARYIASPTYMLNCSLGTLLLVIASVLVVIKGDDIAAFLAMMPIDGGIVNLAAVTAVCLIGTMNDLTAPSVSLEGKSIWIAQSLPVRPQDVLHAKINFHMLMTAIPQLLCTVCLCAVLRTDAVSTLLMIVLPVVFTLSIASLGLIINLLKPNLSWQSEAAVVKQSIGVLMALLCGWAIIAILVGGYLWLGDKLSAMVYMCLAAVLLAVLSFFELRWLNTRGSAIYAHL